MQNKHENAYCKMQQAHQKEFNEFPHFFAFSDEQFAEGMKKLGLTPGDRKKVVTVYGAGDVFRRSDIPALRKMQQRHMREHKEAIDADTTGEGFIRDMFSCELANHEYSYTQDLTDTLNCLGLTVEAINASPALIRGLELAIQDQKGVDWI